MEEEKEEEEEKTTPVSNGKLDQFLHAMKMKGIDIGILAATWVTKWFDT